MDLTPFDLSVPLLHSRITLLNEKPGWGNPVRANVKRIEDVTGSTDPVYIYRLINWVSIYAKQRVAVKRKKWREITALLGTF